MKVNKIGVIVRRADGLYTLSGWDVEGLEGISTNPAVALSNLAPEQKAELVRLAKQNGTYIESDVLNINEVMKLLKIREGRK